MSDIFWDLLCQIKSEINSLARERGRGWTQELLCLGWDMKPAVLSPTCTPLSLEAGHFQDQPRQGRCGADVLPSTWYFLESTQDLCSVSALPGGPWASSPAPGVTTPPQSRFPCLISARSFFDTWRWLVSLLVLLFSYCNYFFGCFTGDLGKGETYMPRCMLPQWTGIHLNSLILLSPWLMFIPSK